jgi:hypothetical protein
MVAIKYTPELTARISALYTTVGPDGSRKSVTDICAELLTEGIEVPERSIIAKLSSLGVYKKKEYLTKRGETPTKKAEYIERISLLLDCNQDMLESLEKVNKSVLALLTNKLSSAQTDSLEKYVDEQ